MPRAVRSNLDDFVKGVVRRGGGQLAFPAATEDDVATIQKLRAQGMATEDISARLRLSFDSVRKVCGVAE